MLRIEDMFSQIPARAAAPAPAPARTFATTTVDGVTSNMWGSWPENESGPAAMHECAGNGGRITPAMLARMPYAALAGMPAAGGAGLPAAPAAPAP